MAATVWCLYATDGCQDWAFIEAFETLALASKRIRDLEVLPLAGEFLEVRVGEDMSDDDALSLFQCAGLKTSYAIRHELA